MTDIYQKHFNTYRKSSDRKLKLEKRHYSSVYNSVCCRTAKIGVTRYHCISCDHSAYIYRSCKNRFCAQCGNLETRKWAKESLQRLLNIKHHHVVFTLPQPFRHIAKLNEKLFYDILFKATAKAMSDWFKHKHNILPGIVSVLHTSGSDLKYHPHIHMIVSGGGQSIQTKNIKQLNKDYLTRQRFMANKFKQFFFIQLFSATAKNKIILPSKFKGDKNNFFKWARNIRDKHWIVSIQKPLNNIEQIVGYVGRYTKRACLSEYKIHSVDDNTIKIVFNDYKNTPKNQKPLQSIKSFKINEFFDQLLQHVPIKRFKMVRYYGLYTSHHKTVVSEYSQAPLENTEIQEHQWSEFEQYRKLEIANGKPDPLICPHCKTHMFLDKVIFSKTFSIDDS